MGHKMKQPQNILIIIGPQGSGLHPRVTFQLTGVITDQTRRFLASLQ